MSAHGYQSGRLNLPFVGISTFGKSPLCLDWETIEADVAVLGAPYDFGTQWRAGARFGPRAIREASTLFSFGHAGAYDHEDDVTYLPADKVRMVDIGDADMELSRALLFEEILTQNSYIHEFHLYSGDHTETYWSAHVDEYMLWYVKQWQKEPTEQ